MSIHLLLAAAAAVAMQSPDPLAPLPTQPEAAPEPVLIPVNPEAQSVPLPDASIPAQPQTVVPSISAEAHKGVRGRLAIIGGGGGMTGAAVLAARAAMRSGIGLVRPVPIGRRAIGNSSKDLRMGPSLSRRRRRGTH